MGRPNYIIALTLGIITNKQRYVWHFLRTPRLYLKLDHGDGRRQELIGLDVYVEWLMVVERIYGELSATDVVGAKAYVKCNSTTPGSGTLNQDNLR